MRARAAWSAEGGSWSVLVHGGAGELALEQRGPHAEGCRIAALAAAEILRGGGHALDAVQRAVEVLEDDPRFNAGTGGSLTSEGRLELDAAIMDGRSLRAGGVCALPPFKHPIAVARAILERAGHVLYAAQGAAAFAKQAGFTEAAESEMITDTARARLARALAGSEPPLGTGGTVGAVARDRAGNVAAATSTGGIVGKRPGRVGDSPIPGAGTYADNLAGAASATGQGEGILRAALTANVMSALRAGAPVADVVRDAIERLGARVGTTCGLIAVHRSGRLALARTTETMSWAAAWDGAESICGT